MSEPGRVADALFWIFFVLIWVISIVKKLARRTAQSRALVKPSREETIRREPVQEAVHGETEEERIVYEAPEEGVEEFLRRLAGSLEPEPVILRPAPRPMPQQPLPVVPVEQPETVEPPPPETPVELRVVEGEAETPPVEVELSLDELRRNIVMIELLGPPRALRAWDHRPEW